MISKTKSPSPWKRPRYGLEVLAVKAVAWVVPKFSRRTIQRTGQAFGWLAYRLAPKLRRISHANLDTAFGDSKSRMAKARIACASLQNVAATLLGLFWAPRLARARLDKFVELDADSLERVRRIQARGKGVIFCTLHYGDWELLGLATGFYGILSTVVQDTMDNQALGEILGRLRAVSGHRIISNHRAATKLVKALKRGECVALLIDQYLARHHGGEWMDFFGLQVSNSPAIGWLAVHSEAAIIPAVAIPLPDGRVRIEYCSEIVHEPTGDKQVDARAINQKCLAFCERVIRGQPEHWLWSYKRWKARPVREQGRYPYYSVDVSHRPHVLKLRRD